MEESSEAIGSVSKVRDTKIVFVNLSNKRGQGKAKTVKFLGESNGSEKPLPTLGRRKVIKSGALKDALDDGRESSALQMAKVWETFSDSMIRSAGNQFVPHVIGRDDEDWEATLERDVKEEATFEDLEIYGQWKANVLKYGEIFTVDHVVRIQDYRIWMEPKLDTLHVLKKKPEVFFRCQDAYQSAWTSYPKEFQFQSRGTPGYQDYQTIQKPKVCKYKSSSIVKAVNELIAEQANFVDLEVNIEAYEVKSELSVLVPVIPATVRQDTFTVWDGRPVFFSALGFKKAGASGTMIAGNIKEKDINPRATLVRTMRSCGQTMKWSELTALPQLISVDVDRHDTEGFPLKKPRINIYYVWTTEIHNVLVQPEHLKIGQFMMMPDTRNIDDGAWQVIDHLNTDRTWCQTMHPETDTRDAVIPIIISVDHRHSLQQEMSMKIVSAVEFRSDWPEFDDYRLSVMYRRPDERWQSALRIAGKTRPGYYEGFSLGFEKLAEVYEARIPPVIKLNEDLALAKNEEEQFEKLDEVFRSSPQYKGSYDAKQLFMEASRAKTLDEAVNMLKGLMLEKIEPEY